MLMRALDYLQYLIWYQPIDVLAAVAFCCAVGLVAGTGASALVQRWRRTRAVQLGEVRPLWGLCPLWGLGTGLATLLFCLSDWALLRTLPWLRLSFSTNILGPLLASVVMRLALLWGMLATVLVLLWRAHDKDAPHLGRGVLATFLALNAALSLVQAHAYVVEPLLVQTTELSFASLALDADVPPVRIVQLSDTHIERNSYREARVIRQVNAAEPDIVVLTGDYLNLSRLRDPVSADHFRQFVSQIRAPYGIYAVRGSVEPTLESMVGLIEGTDVTWLEQESVTLDVRGQRLTLVGVACSHRLAQDRARLAQALARAPDDTMTVLLYHSPDLIEAARERQVDLYLGGHTHGGQLRLPLYGAIATGSAYGKQFEHGLYVEGDTAMYISRGIGFEGGGMPRARFLCPPEIVRLDLGGVQ
jgi:predicted MPP superfamily phosphohydrolase